MPAPKEIAAAIPESRWCGSGNGCRYRAVDDAGSVSPGELVLGYALDEVGEPLVSFCCVRTSESGTSFPLGHHGIERVDATVGHGVPGWPPRQDERQMAQRLFLPPGHAR